MLNWNDIPEKRRYVFLEVWPKVIKARQSTDFERADNFAEYVYCLELKIQTLKYVEGVEVMKILLGFEVKRCQARLREVGAKSRDIYNQCYQASIKASRDFSKWRAKAEANYDHMLREFKEINE